MPDLVRRQCVPYCALPVRRRRCHFVLWVWDRLSGVGVGAAVFSCGGVALSPADAGKVDEDADASTVDTEAQAPDASACLPLLDASEPPSFVQVGLDGGVPLDQVAFAEAFAYCSYLNRCSAMAEYVVNECVTAFSQHDSWTYSECDPRAPAFSDYTCEVVETISRLTSARLEAVDAGLIRYDPDAETACLSALQTQPCRGDSLWYNVAPCMAVFSCAADAGGAGSSNATDSGEGPGCTKLLTGTPSLEACATGGDCADASAGPYCVGGYCYAASCGDPFACLHFVGKGQPCDSDPPKLGNSTLPGSFRCAPDLTCRGAPGDGGLGTCVTPGAVGGPCSEGTAISGCALGLICQCGACRIPPSEGPCALNACKLGVAYCDVRTNTCVPAKSEGADCTADSPECAPDLSCETTTNTCELPVP